MVKSYIPLCRRAFTPELLFAVSWFLAVGIGFWLSLLTGSAVLELFYHSGHCMVSFANRILVLAWPFALLMSGVLLYGRNAVYPICCIKGLLYGFCAGCTVRCFGSAGFVGWFALLFFDTAMLWMLCWYGLRRLRLVRKGMLRDLIPVGLAALVFCFADRILIAPFLETLII